MWNDQQKSDYLIAFLKNLPYIAVIVINCSFLFSLSLYYYILLFIYLFLLFVVCRLYLY